MAAPRCVRPGVTHMITRRCAGRAFRLRPSGATNEILQYCYALAAHKTGVDIHAIVVMSNHHHALVTDREGRLPDFLRELHRLTAKAMNASQGQWENLWAAEAPHELEVGDSEDLLRRIAYMAANPVEAGLVPTPEEWPGVLHLPSDDERGLRVQRPKAYFGPRSRSPREIELRITPPPRIRDVAARVGAAVAEAVERARAAVAAKGWSFLGRAKVLSTSFVKRARSLERKRKIVPRVAARSMFVRVRMLDAIREFRRAYHAALATWRAGERSAEFPDGTWWMRVFHGANVVSAPSL